MRRGSTVAAAAELGLTHGAVSRRVHALEERLGTPLLTRGRGGRLVATDAGEKFAAVAAKGLRLLAEGAAAARPDEARSKSVRVSTTSSIAVLWLLPRLHRFRAHHPGFEAWVYESQAMIEPGTVSDIEVAIRMGRGEWPGVRAEPLMRDELVAVCSPVVAAKLHTPADVAHAVLLHDGDRSAQWWHWTEAAGLGRPSWASRGPRLAAVLLLVQAAVAGEGVALVPGRLAGRHLSDGRLVTPFDATVGLGTLYWLVQPQREATLPARAFCNWLRAEAKRET